MVYRLQLERDVLERATEVLKKDEGINLNTLRNCEKAEIIGALRKKGLRTFYWPKWSPTSLFYTPLDLVRQETALFVYPGTKPYTNQYAA